MQGRKLALAGLIIGYTVTAAAVIGLLYLSSNNLFAPSSGGGWNPVVPQEGGADPLGFPPLKK